MRHKLWMLFLIVGIAVPFSPSAKEWKSENVELVVAGCKLSDFDLDDPDNFGRGFAEVSKKIVNIDGSIAFQIILFIKYVRQDVPVKWVLMWRSKDTGNGVGTEYNGTISQAASPEAEFTGIFVDDPIGNRMRVVPLQAPAKRRFVQRGAYNVSLFSLKIDGNEVDVGECEVEYQVQ